MKIKKDTDNIKFATMPTRFLPTHWLTHEKAGWHGSKFFFVMVYSERGYIGFETITKKKNHTTGVRKLIFKSSETIIRNSETHN